MLRRLFRSAIMLAVLVAAYNAYVLWAVPQMEPPLATREQQRLTKSELGSVENPATKYQLLLSNYFPKDHWSQTRPPKVIANATEQVMLVFDDFKRSVGTGQRADGSPTTQVDIERIAFLMFPTPPREGVLPPRDAVIFEAPQGAHLEFDDFRPEVAHIGQIIRGEFPGPIRIHSDMHAPGPEDDLVIEVADLAMNTKLLYTSKPDSPVRFRMGENAGSGTDLEIRFLADEHSRQSDPGLKIAGIDSLEIRRDVKMRLALGAGSLLPGGKDVRKENTQSISNPSVQVTDASTVKPAAAKPPVEVSCSGPFTFDCVRYVASLDRDVELRQTDPNGPSDQLTATRLDIHFAPKAGGEVATAAAVGDPQKRQTHDLGRLEPSVIVAEGHPVVMTSAGHDAQARGDRIQIVLKEQRVRISGGNDALLNFGPNILQAPIIDYQHPSKDEGTSIGRFRATGPGSLRYVIDPTKPQEVLQAQWQTSVQLGRDKGQPVLVLDGPSATGEKSPGQAKLSYAETGSLKANQIYMYLRELDGKRAEGLTIGGNGANGQSKVRLAPDRLVATGHVDIQSPRFTGHTEQFSTNFQMPPVAAPAEGGQEKPAANTSGAASPLLSPIGGNGGQTASTYLIEADQMRLEVLLKGRATVPDSLVCDGHILLKEIPLVQTNQQPFEVHGGQLTVEQLDSKSPHVTLHGTAPGEPPAPAQLAGRGMTMLVDTIEATGGGNRVWSNGPGKATLQVTRSMTGQPSATPIPMDVTWQNGFQFDGQSVVFKQGVVVAGMDSTVHCDQLAAKLASKLQTGQPMNQTNVNMSEIECSGQVSLENVTRDLGGVTSHSSMQLASLSVNQQTGAIAGTGPGTIRTTRFGSAMTAIAGPPGAPPQAIATKPANSAGNKLFFLRVDFRTGLDGNIYTKELTFHDRIRTVYGPVDSWEQELDLARPESLPPDSLTLTCENLRLNEDPLSARVVANSNASGKRPQIQMQAKGDVRITGQVPAQGEFSVQADRASYEEAKDTFVLEGNAQTPAKLWRRNGSGVDSPPTEARRISYVRSTGDVKVIGIQYFEITPQDLQNARRPNAPAK